MADKQCYVKIDFEYGVDNGDGTFEVKNDGSVRWISMHREDAVGLQNYAIIPAMNDIATKAGELGLLANDMDLPAAKPGKPKP